MKKGEMLIPIALIALVALAAFFANPKPAHFQVISVSGAKGIIIPESAASINMEMLKPCSRSGPRTDTISGFWTPAVGDVQKLEQLLPAYIEKTDDGPAESGDEPISLSNYTRYYLGISYLDKKIIYADFYALSPKETGLPASVCDGGRGFFGVEYDIEHASFSNLRFNGAG